MAEPTMALPLRWGTWQGRSIAGAALIVGGMIGLQAASTTFLLPLITGTVAHVVGWWIMPAAGWRRHVVVFPCGVQIWLILTGPQSMWTLIVPYLAWLLVRHRPLRSYVTGLFVIAYGVFAASVFSEYSQLLPALAGAMAVIAGSALVARKIAGVRRIHSHRTPSFR
ncbi:hypothetical protein [Ruicaihuangia caeni]|uniref:Uncharacterized protein n=1 Tax=Ruicaihuangia caeni TaxID=3042517 RepID=A0AAW6T7G6_9MICO|nr:hypothetical protein [Klugiella sp. YN-L-19]MDI2098636.1 hypothetical protein [Klugiella sp. YN-L-19]